MRSIDVPLKDRTYPVLVGSGLLGDRELWNGILPDTRLLVLTNDKVGPLYLETLFTALGERDAEHMVLPDGEDQKNLTNWSRVLDRLADMQAGRDACLVALGGGVIGDLCGFAAAAWMRGIRFIQVPTTLLAQVDASVGGKTAINHARGKNLVGAFHQPTAVVADIDTLSTLPDREYQAGLAEVVKYGAIRDAGFLDWLEANIEPLKARDPDTLIQVVEISVRHKAEVVAEDELEAGVRATLNFGHTFAHAIETLTGYRQFLHGEAVAIGMVAAARLSEQRGLCPEGVAQRLASLQAALGLPVGIPPDLATSDLLDLMKLDKKNLAGKRRLVLLKQAGKAFVDAGSEDTDIGAAIDSSRP